MGNQPIRLLIVDDHTMVRRGMKVLLDEYEDIQVVGEAANGLKAIELVDQLKPDVILIQTDSPSRDTLENMAAMDREMPRPVVVFANDSDSAVPIVIPDATGLSPEEIGRYAAEQHAMGLLNLRSVNRAVAGAIVAIGVAIGSSVASPDPPHAPARGDRRGRSRS